MEYGRIPDVELVRRFREGDVLAFEAILEKYSQPIHNFTLRMLGNRDDAEDATQQTFIQAYESLPGARPEAPLRPWLYQVARHKAIDLIRRRRSVALSTLEREDDDHPSFDITDDEPLPDAVYEHAELQQFLQEAILTLPVRTREVVVMRYVGELTFAEIGQSLGIPENTAKTLFQRAKPLLRGYLRRRM
jgi:RNA polymerase sigma-70 factor (ECF subfamily)